MNLLSVSENRWFYPETSIPHLRSQYGKRWEKLVDWVSNLRGSDPQVMAFARTMRHIISPTGSDQSARRDSFCGICAHDILRHFEGTEEDLLRLFFKNLSEITATLASMKYVKREDRTIAA